MNVFSKFAGAVAVAACMTAASVAPANASLIVYVNDGNGGALAQVAFEGTNTDISYYATIGAYRITFFGAYGQAVLAAPVLMDVGALIRSTGAAGILTLRLTQTNISSSGAAALFGTSFTGNIMNANVTRSVYLDPTNSGQLTTLLTTTNLAIENVISPLQVLPLYFSLTEEIVITATGKAVVSTDDLTQTVPEPGSLALLALALLSLFSFAMTRRRANA